MFRMLWVALLLAGLNTGAVAQAQSLAPESEDTILTEVALDEPELDTSPLPVRSPRPLLRPAETGRLMPNQPLSPDEPDNATAPITLSTTKVGIPTHEIGTAATVITRRQIQQMQPFSLTEVLRTVPGVDVVQNGYLGATSSIFMRGMNAGHTLILLDGVRLNDPIAPDRTFSFIDQISPDAVERVEVLRGPQNSLYGSDAMGGVINIITRQGETGKPTLYAKITAGSQGALQEDLAVRGQWSDKLKSFWHMTRQDVRGISAASSRYGMTSFGTRYNNAEPDGFHNTSIMGRTEFTPRKNLTLDLVTLLTRARYDLDSSGGYMGDDPNFTGTNRILTLSGGSRLKLFDNRYEQVTRIAFTDNRRENLNEADAFSTYKSHDRYSGKLLNLDFQNNFYLHRSNTLTAGLNLQHEWGNSYYHDAFFPTTFNTRSATNTAFYVQDHIQLWNRWFTTLGYRLDHHNRFGGSHNFRAASTYVLPKTGTRLKGSLGTGFKAPTLSQLYGNFGPNPNLKPETSLGWDAGIEQGLFAQKIQLGATVFQNQVKNLIDFKEIAPFTSLYYNVNQARTQGLETYLTSQPFSCLQLRASYTYTDTKTLSAGANQGDPLLRRPRNKLSLNINYHPTNRLNVNLDITHTGDRSDVYFSPVTFSSRTLKLKAYTLINLALEYTLTDHVTLYGRLVNLLDTPYETVKGYGAPRISAYGGLKLAL